MSDPRPREPLAPSNAPAPTAARSRAAVAETSVTFTSEQGTRWRVYDLERIDRRPHLVAIGSRRATHRQFVVVGKYPEAHRYAFTGRDPDEHDLDPARLGMQLYLGKRVKPPRRRASER